MIEFLIQLIVSIVIIGLLWYALNLALSLLPIDARVRTALTVIAVLVLVLIIVSFFGDALGFPLP